MNRSASVALALSLGAAVFGGVAACSSDPETPNNPAQAGTGGMPASAGNTAAGSGGAPAPVAGAAGSGMGGTTAGAATGGAAVGGAGSGSGGAAGGAGGGSAGAGGSAAGAGTGGAPTGTAPTCKKETPSPNNARPIECDYLLQSIDFEDKYSYASPPAAIRVTNYGKAVGQTAVNKCSPVCFGKNLTVGIDIVGGKEETLKGEVIVDYPATGGGLPIAAADNTRNILAWITFDGDAKPSFEIDTQLVLQTADGVVASTETKPYFKPGGNQNPFGPFSIVDDYSYKNGAEFKYFNATGSGGFPTAPKSVTGIGFRFTAKATAGQEWHGVAYIDHLQVRAGSPKDPDENVAGKYPYGL